MASFPPLWVTSPELLDALEFETPFASSPEWERVDGESRQTGRQETIDGYPVWSAQAKVIAGYTPRATFVTVKVASASCPEVVPSSASVVMR